MQPRTVRDIVALVGGVLVQGDPETIIHGVTTDSRRVQPGQLFVPLRGERFDGHEFIAGALSEGAAATFVARGREQSLFGSVQGSSKGALIVVADPLHALQLLAAATRRELARVENRVVAVTGSVGKTTTKDMLAAILSRRWETTSTSGNFNNEIGLPLTLLQADDTTEALVLEMGMRALGEIRELARIARPDVAVVTNVSPVHLGPLGSMERIAVAKRELVDELSPDGVAVLNGDDDHVKAMGAHVRGRTVMYGIGPNNDVRAEDIVSEGMDGIRFTLVWGEVRERVRIPVPGRHNVYNGLAAAATAIVLGLDSEHMNDGFAQFAAARTGMRLHFQERDDGLLVIDDAYNAGPASMNAALDVLQDVPQGRRRVAVLGDMLELGALAVEAHEQLGRRAVSSGVDVLIAVGDHGADVARGAKEAGMHEGDVFVRPGAEEAAVLVVRLIRNDDVVLVKGSRGVALERVVGRLLTPKFDEPVTSKEAPR